MRERVKGWIGRWDTLLKRLEAQGATVCVRGVEPDVDEEHVRETETRLGIGLPSTVRQIIAEGAGKVAIYWYFDKETWSPFASSGELGWSLDAFEWPYFGDDELEEEKRYLVFHVAGNGDYVLLDLEGDPDDPPVVNWGHETVEFQRLAPSFTEFVERVTELAFVGAEEWEYEPFCGPDGLDVEGPEAKAWKAWLDRYLTLTLEEAAKELPLLLDYITFHKAENEGVREALARYEPADVLDAWLSRLEEETHPANRDRVLGYIGGTVGEAAADWVRSLWSDQPPVEVSNDSRAYLSASCLPEREGLERVLAQWAHLSKIDGYSANRLLWYFHSRDVIRWMESRVSFPFGGWDSLFASSAPHWEDVCRWLDGHEAMRQTVLSALGQLFAKGEAPEGEPDRGEILRLLDKAEQEGVLKKEKEAARQVMAHLADWR
ncbi:SMI1 / KNR4 family (SUKH-1) [Paenibacillus tianmuensis]|uniref:SMI1 / KNR4 family (SUKH-1) n=1 Tax=Paenibacillus tianmuensis TaxID=624147 RepID=A0A1G4Q987_9BACL|nr:SMI1/KNR4 family protein [Paenibacillus tianmuensis]SCW41150.1 SMI1 / KNR4 family (SUKH-1) [Paenibacillus tianmuensis]